MVTRAVEPFRHEPPFIDASLAGGASTDLARDLLTLGAARTSHELRAGRAQAEREHGLLHVTLRAGAFLLALPLMEPYRHAAERCPRLVGALKSVTQSQRVVHMSATPGVPAPQSKAARDAPATARPPNAPWHPRSPCRNPPCFPDHPPPAVVRLRAAKDACVALGGAHSCKLSGLPIGPSWGSIQ